MLSVLWTICQVLLGLDWEKTAVPGQYSSLTMNTFCTFCGFASSRICVMAAGGRMGLNAGSSVLVGGCSFTFITYVDNVSMSTWWRSDSKLHPVETVTQQELTLGTAAWKRMLVAGVGAEDSMEMMTTRTSGRDGGQSRANVNKTRRLCLSNTVTGNWLPVIQVWENTTHQNQMLGTSQVSELMKGPVLTGFDGLQRHSHISQRDDVTEVSCRGEAFICSRQTEVGQEVSVGLFWLGRQTGGSCRRWGRRGRASWRSRFRASARLGLEIP